MFGLNKYLLGGVGVLCVTIALLYWRLDAVSEARDRFKADSERKTAVIVAMEAEAMRNEQILSELRATQDAIRADNVRTRRAIANLERSNEEVRAFLDEPVPADLAGLLWPSEAGDDPAAPPG